MPEVPDLEAIREFFNQRVAGHRIEEARLLIPVVARFPSQQFADTLEGDSIAHIHRHGKFLLFQLLSGHVLVINPMLTGRFQYVEPGEKRRAKTCAIVRFDTGRELRYVDERLMGKLYLVPSGELATVPQFPDMGPDVLAPALTGEVFRQRLRKHPGEIKNILVNHKFVAGIGNAYADEILWEARVHPYRRRATLSDEEEARIYPAVHAVLEWAIPILHEKMRDELAYNEWREHLRVHRKGGEPCPRCGSTISEVTARQRITNFCRTCQPERPHDG